MSVIITVRELEELAFEDELVTKDGIQLKTLEVGEWVSGGKYETQKVIFTDGERSYLGQIERSGSYFSDYTYGSEWGGDSPALIIEVRKVPVTIERWEAVLDRGYLVYETEYPEEGSHFVTQDEYDTHIANGVNYTISSSAVKTNAGWVTIKEAVR